MKNEATIDTFPRVMILEDDDLLRNTMIHMSKKIGVEYCEAKDGKQALSKVEEFKPDVFFVDLEMPVMDGKEFISKMKENSPESLFVVMTAHSEPHTIIETMNLGVFDYILKPIDATHYKDLLKQVSEELKRRRVIQLFEEESNLRLKEQLGWVSYKRSRVTDLDSMIELSRTTLNNIKYALLSGGGIGTLISLVKMIKSSANKVDSNYVISSDLVDMLYESSDYIEKNINRLEESLTLLHREVAPHLKRVTVSHLIEKLTEHFQTFSLNEKEYLETKGLTFRMPNVNHNHYQDSVMIDLDSFLMIFYELLVNALKYSDKNGEVDVYFSSKSGLFNLYVKNNFDSKYLSGISAEQESLVKQPFYRLAKFLDESVKTEGVFSGLGLTLVDIIARKHGGSFGIKNVTDHTISDKPETVVLAAITLPVC
ncbi:response regulator [Leptospira stimsonii]|uniref:Regulator n=1 Tax=Leptospira stimsonii TaxID=2202203 RepID=A0A4R9L6C8_9LEPT|nr:response regulator [Leptospira stimsonii]RHX88867.1 regulator [Leptospira stimsonii]TGK17804.1 response regulator [Leptospira stimsonii]TGM12646.1 response regulator [Leptospira stimsonii]